MREGYTFEDYTKDISERFSIPLETLTYDCSLIDDLGIDSLAIFNLMNQLEAEFDIQLDVTEMLELGTIGKVYEYLMSLVRADTAGQAAVAVE